MSISSFSTVPQVFDQADTIVSGGASTVEEYCRKCDESLDSMRLNDLMSTPSADAPDDPSTIRILSGQCKGAPTKTIVCVQEFPIEFVDAVQETLILQHSVESDILHKFQQQQQLIRAHKPKSVHWILPHEKNGNKYLAYPSWCEQKGWKVPASKSWNLFPSCDRLMLDKERNKVRLERVITRSLEHSSGKVNTRFVWIKKATQLTRDATRMKKQALELRRKVFAQSQLVCTLMDEVVESVDVQEQNVPSSPPVKEIQSNAQRNDLSPLVDATNKMTVSRDIPLQEPPLVQAPGDYDTAYSTPTIVPIPEDSVAVETAIPVTPEPTTQDQPLPEGVQEPAPETKQDIMRAPIPESGVVDATAPEPEEPFQDATAQEEEDSVVSGVSGVSGLSNAQTQVLIKQLSENSLASPTSTMVAPYQAEITVLIRQLDPSQEEFIDLLLAQFRGREDELLESLQEMKQQTQLDAASPMVTV